MTTMTRTTESTASPFTSSSPTLFLAFDLGDRSWTLGFSTGLGQRPRLRKVAAGATERVAEEITRAKRRLQLPAEAPVVS